MAYYTGTVNNFADLKAVIESAATDTGWTLLDGILNKYGHFVRLAVGTNGGFPFLSILAATSQSNGILTGQVSAGAKIYSSKNMVLAWPGEYFIHAFEREFYCFLKNNVDLYQTLAFGVSDMPGIGGTGGWYGAMANIGRSQNPAYNKDNFFGMSCSNGSISAGNTYYNDLGSLGSPFWASSGSDIFSQIHIVLDVFNGWVATGNRGISSVAALLTASPNLLNGGHVLLPVKNVAGRTGGGVTNLLQHEHLRWLRNDLIENEEIISYGGDYWKCYPVLRRNIGVRDGVYNGAPHSGTLGYAVRYDGP